MSKTAISITLIDDMEGSMTVVKSIAYNTCALSDGAEAFQKLTDVLDKWSGLPIIPHIQGEPRCE